MTVSLGRFTQADTLVPNSGFPLAFDRYAYSFNNPTNYTDPSGHSPCYGINDPAAQQACLDGWRAAGGDPNYQDVLESLYDGPGAWQHRARRNMGEIIFRDENVTCSWGAMCVLGLMSRAYYHEERAVILGEGLDLLMNDPELIKLQGRLVDSVKNDPRYGQEAFTRTPSIGNRVTFGQYGNMLVDATHSETWMVRLAQVDADIHATKSGDIFINYQVFDTLDLRPDWENPARTKSGYNHAVTVLGFLWHDWGGASDQMEVYAHWMTVISGVE